MAYLENLNSLSQIFYFGAEASGKIQYVGFPGRAVAEVFLSSHIDQLIWLELSVIPEVYLLF